MNYTPYVLGYIYFFLTSSQCQNGVYSHNTICTVENPLKKKHLPAFTTARFIR